RGFPGEKILTRGREDIDDLGALRKPRLVLHPARDDGHRARAARASLVAEPEVHLAGQHPEDLLVRVRVGRRIHAGLHRPPDDHGLLAREDAARDLVGDLFLGKVLQGEEAWHQRHRGTSQSERHQRTSAPLRCQEIAGRNRGYHAGRSSRKGGRCMARLKIGFIPIEGGHYYRESLEEVTRAEELGFDSVWMEEHHSVANHYWPSPLVVLAGFATRTSRLTLGTR